MEQTIKQFQKREKDELIRSLKLQAISNKEILTIDEASIFTGYSKSYLYKLNSVGSDMPVYSSSKGSKLFFKKSELEQWLTGCEKTKAVYFFVVV